MNDHHNTHSLYEQFRLARLQRLGILDTPPEERFDRITAIAREVYGVEIALVSLVDEKRQWFKSAQGVDVCATERAVAVCDHAIRQDDVFVVPDASQDERFANNPLVTGPLHLRFYAGMPIREPTGFKVGTLCVIDKQPRHFDAKEFETLKHLARMVESEIERSFGLDDCRVELDQGKLNRAIQRAQNLVLGAGSNEDTFQILLNDLMSLTGAEFGLITHMRARAEDKPSMNVLAMSDMDCFPVGNALTELIQRSGIDAEEGLADAAALDSRLRRLLVPEEGNKTFPSGPAILSMPVVLSGEFAGLVCLMFGRPAVDPGLEEPLSPLLHTVGILIERIRLRQEQMLGWQKMQRSVQRDALTGLLNRRGLAEALDKFVQARADRPLCLCLYVLDVDNFAVLNQENGREAGDMALKHLARKLSALDPERCLVGRIGGDEFVLLVKNDAEANLFPNIQAMLAEGVNGMRIEVSVGTSLYPQDSKDPEQLLRFAHKALFKAKETGKNRCEHFDLKEHESVRDIVALREAVTRGLEQDEFVLFYQPKIALQTQEVNGFEALIRWQHPERGLIMPDQFLPAVQHTELDTHIGLFVLDTAVDTLKLFALQGVPYGVSINISPQQFLSRGFVDHLEAVLSPLDASIRQRLTLEIIETAAIDDNAAAQMVIRACQNLGVQVSLDDFGTGFSSLSYFRELPMNEVKIDRTFVFNLLTVPEDAMIVESVIDLCRRFNRIVVAEGIESAEHAQRLRELGCHVGQGYHYSKALPLAQALGWAEQYAANLSANDDAAPLPQSGVC